MANPNVDTKLASKLGTPYANKMDDTETHTAVVVAPTAGNIVVPKFAPAGMSRRSDAGEIPAEFAVLGSVPWEDYWHVEKGAILRGVLVGMFRRYVDDENDPGVKVRKETLVFRVTQETKCSRTINDPSYQPRGEVVVADSDDADEPTRRDIYKVPAGTLVATDYRRVLSPLLPFAKGKMAAECYILCKGKKRSEKDSTRKFWTFDRGARVAGYERDTSLDYLNEAAEMTLAADREGDRVPF